VRTIQFVNYTDATAEQYGSAWVVEKATICNKVGIYHDTNARQIEEDLSKPGSIVLTFVAGPNCGATRGASSSTGRTLNKNCNTPATDEDGWKLLTEGTRAAIRAGLDAMIMKGVTVAVLSRVSGGIYAGNYKERFRGKHEEIVKDLLDETLPNGKQRGLYFKKVYL